MKSLVMKKFRSGMSLFLAAVMAFGTPCTAFAQESAHAETKSYVSLGDSMTNGYGLDGYDVDDAGNILAVNGYLDHVAESYPAQVANHFGWDLTPMAISGMRAEDLHFILEYDYVNGTAGDYKGDAYTQKDFVEGRFNDYEDKNVSVVAKEMQTAIADADVISVAIGNANFGVYLTYRLTGVFGVLDTDDGNQYQSEFEESLIGLDEETQALAIEVFNMVKGQLASYAEGNEMLEDVVDPVADVIGYTTVSYMRNYRGMIDRIVELNDDAEIVLVGLMNTMADVKIEYENEGEVGILDMGEVMTPVFDAMNYFITAYPTSKQSQGNYPNATFYYAEAEGVDVLVRDFAIAADNNWEGYAVVRDRIHKQILTSLFPLVAEAGTEVTNVSLETIAAYEKMDVSAIAAYAATNPVEAVSCALYLGFEDAIVEASRLDMYNAKAFIALAEENGIENIFSGILGIYQENVAAAAPSLMEAGVPEALVKLVATPEALSAALQSDLTIRGLLNLFARMLVGNGIGGHPNAAGHDTLTASFVNAYGNRTANDATSEKTMEVMMELLGLIEEYGPDAYAYAEENGYFEPYTTATYYVNADAYYVALGDRSTYAYGLKKTEGYVDRFAEALGLGENQYENLCESCECKSVTDCLAEVEKHADEIKKSTLVTVGFTTNAIAEFAVNKIMGKDSKELDWSEYFPEKVVVMIDEKLVEMKQEFLESGLTEQIAEYMVVAIEAYAYAYVEYAYNLPELVSSIKEINPDTQVIIVGMYNPLKGLVVGEGDAALEAGDYLDKLIKLSDLYTLGYAMATGDAIFVSAPEVETIAATTGKNDLMTLIAEYLLNKAKNLHASAAGHEYIKDQLMEAMTIKNSCQPTKPSSDCPALKFTDMNFTKWYHLHVDYCVENGLIYGTSDTAFSPNMKVTRGMIVSILYRLSGEKATSEDVAAMTFKDVNANKYYAKAIAWAQSNGVVYGTSNTTFEPEAPITRQEMVAILNRYAKHKGYDTSARTDLSVYPDVNEVKSWAKTPLSWAVAEGLFYGSKTSSGVYKINANGYTTRAEATSFIYRFCMMDAE